MGALQFAEIAGFVLIFGWRSAGAPGTPGFGVMGWRVYRCDKCLIFSAGFSR